MELEIFFPSFNNHVGDLLRSSDKKHRVPASKIFPSLKMVVRSMPRKLEYSQSATRAVNIGPKGIERQMTTSNSGKASSKMRPMKGLI